MISTLLVASAKKAHSASLLESIDTFLVQQNVNVVDTCVLDGIEDAQRVALQARKANVDLVISIGGDGSLLRLAHVLGLPLPPFVGINIGSLGFLAEISANNITTGLYDVIHGAYEKTERLVLDGKIVSQNSTSSSFSINECTIHRGSYSNLIDITIHVDGIFLNTFSCDGMIIATPSGSTAYSLSAGGPILTPDLNAIIINPICPHTISNKPIVLLPKTSLTIECVRGSHFYEVSFDGQENFHVDHKDHVTISVSRHRFTTLSPKSGSDYFHTVRSKLGWTGSLRRP